MPTVMITGANRGLGLEFARQYAADGWKVLATCRAPRKATELKSLEAPVTIKELDVLDFEAVHQLAKLWKKHKIDHLVLNAGIYGPRSGSFAGVDFEAWEAVLRTNTMAPLRLATAFADHVAASKRKLMVALSSKMGSISENTSGGAYIYRSSKSALNAVMKSLSLDLAPRGVSVTLLHPGWVRTDMGGPNALIDAEQSVAGMIGVLAREPAVLNGRFFNYDGQPIDW